MLEMVIGGRPPVMNGPVTKNQHDEDGANIVKPSAVIYGVLKL
mgnify:CR=1 FL=1